MAGGWDRNEVIDEVEPIKFEGYQALITNLRLAYTPQQKYMREPFQKVVLGSKYPTDNLNLKISVDVGYLLPSTTF